MKPSTRLLCQQFQLPAILSAVAIGLIMGLCGLIAPWSGIHPWIAACLASTCTILMRPHVRLLRLAGFFPIEDRQAGIIPMALAGALWLAGLAPLLAVQCLQALLGQEWRDFLIFWLSALPALPFLALVLLLVILHAGKDHGELDSPMLVIPAFFVLSSLSSPTLEHCFSNAWPLALAGCWVVVKAAPPSWSATRRQVIKWDQGIASSSVTVESGGRKLASLYTDLAGVIRNGILTLIICTYFPFSGLGAVVRVIPEIFTLRFLQDFLHHPLDSDLWLYLWFLLIPLWIFKYTLRGLLEAQASGLTPRRTMLAALLKLTFVLAPLARRIGLQRGELSLCGACSRSKFVWQTRCPHCRKFSGCGRTGSPTAAVMHEPDVTGAGHESIDPQSFYRYILPMILIILILRLHSSR